MFKLLLTCKSPHAGLVPPSTIPTTIVGQQGREPILALGAGSGRRCDARRGEQKSARARRRARPQPSRGKGDGGNSAMAFPLVCAYGREGARPAVSKSELV